MRSFVMEMMTQVSYNKKQLKLRWRIVLVKIINNKNIDGLFNLF